ncbi:universal stress protein [Desulfohalobium retbaense]|uniref:UspA domain protein n=1 Tax=Desulfohalobium retbaense (strain ATCC 49708 / DSM 5692 / JCM 16813 / HR100) TaxID=485915 RepID=C8X2C9_DESRD|nr:universal stress protein [Desulfohalobium retbaense]ACV68576.1 UspA domain protein [Desulfohalobium retbaense DSM 5692]
MEKHLLLTVSDDASSHSAVQFVGQFFSHKGVVKITLMYVAPNPEDILGTSGKTPTGEKRTEVTRQSAQYQKKGRAALERAWEKLLAAGIPPSNISTIFRFRSFNTTVKDIGQEGEKGLYDAILLGRRGISRFEEMLSDSISKQILEETLTVPIWINREIGLERFGVLLCVDGSNPSLRMADHVGFMLAEEVHPITLCHVQTKGGPDPASVFRSAQSMLEENGVDAKRIQTQVLTGSDPASAIVQETDAKRYAAVAVGSSGEEHRGLMGRFFMGSVSRSLCSQITGASLWVCK